jgi:hypothetical protein
MGRGKPPNALWAKGVEKEEEEKEQGFIGHRASHNDVFTLSSIVDKDNQH